MPADAGVPPIMCDVLAQDCTGDNERCLPASLDGDGVPEATVCSEISPDPRQPGDDCMWEGAPMSGQDNCDKGTWCFPNTVEDFTNNTGMGFCQQLCSGTPAAPTCPEPDQVCEIGNDGALPWCIELCDPLAGDCQRMEDGCYPNVDGTFSCKIRNPGAYGEACTLGNQCDLGLVCATAASVPGCTDQAAVSCCTQLCDTTVSDPDSQCMGQAEGQVCSPYYGDMPPPPGYESLGVCAIPA